MQNTVRWRCSREFLGTPWSNKSDAQPPEGDNPRNLLFSSRIDNSWNLEILPAGRGLAKSTLWLGTEVDWAPAPVTVGCWLCWFCWLIIRSVVIFINIEIIYNKARHNLINVKYRQMVFRSVGGAVVGSFWEPLGQTKVMHSCQWETTHEIFSSRIAQICYYELWSVGISVQFPQSNTTPRILTLTYIYSFHS